MLTLFCWSLQASKKVDALRQVAAYILPPPEPESFASMTVEEPDIVEESALRQVIEGVLGELESKGLETIVAPLKADKKEEEEALEIASRESLWTEATRWLHASWSCKRKVLTRCI